MVLGGFMSIAMGNIIGWTVIFCAECYSGFPPKKLTNYNGFYLCEKCDCSEVLGQVIRKEKP